MLSDDVDGGFKDVFKKGLQFIKQDETRRDIDKQIDITSLMIISASHRSKQSDGFNSIFLLDEVFIFSDNPDAFFGAAHGGLI